MNQGSFLYSSKASLCAEKDTCCHCQPRSSWTIMSSVKAIKLASGSMPQLGFGTWRSEPGKVKTAVQVAITAGYRHIDAAWIYGNEAEVGSGIADSLKEHNLERSSLWVTSKLWNNFHEPKHVRAACEETLRSLRLDYLDLYLSMFCSRSQVMSSCSY